MKNGQLRAHPYRKGPQRNEAAGHGLVHATQKMHQNPRSLQVESTVGNKNMEFTTGIPTPQ